MKMHFFFLVLIILGTGCSKSNVKLEALEKEPFYLERFSSEQAILLVINSKSESELLQNLELIESNHSDQFDWAEFYLKTAELSSIKNANQNVSEHYFELAKFSCNENLDSFYRIFTQRPEQFELLHTIISKFNCDSSMSSTQAARIIQSLSPTNRSSFIKTIVNTKITIENLNDFYSALAASPQPNFALSSHLSNDQMDLNIEDLVNFYEANTSASSDEQNTFAQLLLNSNSQKEAISGHMVNLIENKRFGKIAHSIFIQMLSEMTIDQVGRVLFSFSSEQENQQNININYRELIEYVSNRYHQEHSSLDVNHKQQLMNSIIVLAGNNCEAVISSLILEMIILDGDTVDLINAHGCQVRLSSDNIDRLLSTFMAKVKLLHHPEKSGNWWEQIIGGAISNIFGESQRAQATKISTALVTFILSNRNPNERPIWPGIIGAHQSDFFDLFYYLLLSGKETLILNYIDFILANAPVDSSIRTELTENFTRQILSSRRTFVSATRQAGINIVLKIVNQMHTQNLVAFMEQNLVSTTELLGHLDAAFSEHMKFIKENESWNIRESSLVDSWNSIQSANTIYEKIHSYYLQDDKIKEIRSLLFLAKEKILKSFELTFQNHPLYKNFLAARVHDVDSLWLQLKLAGRDYLKDKKTIKIDYNEDELINVSSEQFMYADLLRLKIHLVENQTEVFKLVSNYCDLFKTENIAENKFNQELEKLEKPGCFKIKPDKSALVSTTIKVNNPEFKMSRYSLLDTKGLHLSILSPEVSVGMLVTNPQYTHPQASQILPERQDGAWVIPFVFKVSVFPSETVSWNFEDSIAGQSYLFRQHLVIPAKPGADPVSTLKGAVAGSVSIKNGELDHLPRLIAFGGEGQLPASPNPGGQGDSGNLSDENFKADYLDQFYTQQGGFNLLDLNRMNFISDANHWNHETFSRFWSTYDHYLEQIEKESDFSLFNTSISAKAKSMLYCWSVEHIRSPKKCQALLEAKLKDQIEFIRSGNAPYLINSTGLIVSGAEMMEMPEGDEGRMGVQGEPGDNGILIISGKKFK